MMQNARNKQVTGASNKQLTERDAFIIRKAKDFTPMEILVLLKSEGFKPIARSRIYQILEENGIRPKGVQTE